MGLGHRFAVFFRRGIRLGPAMLSAALLFSLISIGRGESALPDALIGYTELTTNLKAGRHANIVTMRAMVVRADGTGRRIVAGELSNEPNTWTQFAGWSPDGRSAILGRGWESPENGLWEEEHKQFRFTADRWLYDSFLVDLENGRAENLTGVERVSFYNTGLFFWPGDRSKLGFQALIDGNSHPFQMDGDGRNKRDLTAESREFAYGFSASLDGRRIAYHKSYRVYVADRDGSNARLVETGRPFNFSPQWSPNGSHLLFLAGKNYDCHPHIVQADGTGFRKIADRGGYRGVSEFLDVPDFHGGSSDVPVWAVDGKSIFYTSRVDSGVELFRVTLHGQIERLTETADGSLHYHPQPSPDGRWLVYGSKRDGIRDLYVMSLADKREYRITSLAPGRAAMWSHWQK